jgi:hypothetical protein
MHVDRQARGAAHGLDRAGAKRQMGGEAPIDHVDVHPVRTCRLHVGNLTREMSQVGTQDRRSNQNAAWHAREIHEDLALDQSKSRKTRCAGAKRHRASAGPFLVQPGRFDKRRPAWYPERACAARP